MRIFYFTFGTDQRFPYCGGWVQVAADNIKQAIAIFRAKFPDRTEGLLNCSDYYSEEGFNKSDMPFEGNLGAYCHMKLSLKEELQ